MKRRDYYKHETIMHWYYSCMVKGVGHYWYYKRQKKDKNLEESFKDSEIFLV